MDNFKGAFIRCDCGVTMESDISYETLKQMTCPRCKQKIDLEHVKFGIDFWTLMRAKVQSGQIKKAIQCYSFP